MAINLSQFRTRFPEFDTVLDAVVNFAIQDAADNMDVSRWSTRYDTGQYFLSAHYVALSSAGSNGNSGSVGAVSQASTGPLSVTKNIPMSKTAGDAMLSSTMYGQRYLQLKRVVGMGGTVA